MKRVLAFPLVRLVLIVLLFAILVTPIVLAVHPPFGLWRSIAMTWILAGVLLASMALVERLAAGKLPAAIGFAPRYALRDFGCGLLFGAALFSCVILELTLGGFYRVVAIHVTPSLAIAALLLLPGAAFEELLFRGVIFRLIEEWAGTWIALVVSAVIFGLVHARNPSATWVSTLAIALEAGVLLAVTFVVTKNLWLPIGLHFAWNFFEGPVYGAQVSGTTFLTSALVARFRGPAIFTGGSFGPEAGLAAVVTCVIAAAVLLWVAIRRSLIVAPAWKRASNPAKEGPR
jgi:uncharacterized protein